MRSLSDDTKKTVNSKIMHKLSVNCGGAGTKLELFFGRFTENKPIKGQSVPI